MSGETQTHVGCLVVRTVCGQAGKSIQREIEGWISHNGVEWTTKRFKAIWNAALHLRNGDRVQAVQLYQENSIAYHKRSLLPKGGMGYVVRQFVSAKRPSVLRRYAAVMRYYCSLRLSQVTPAQRLKYEKAITRPPQIDPESKVPDQVIDLALGLLDRRMKTQGITKEHVQKYVSSYNPDPTQLSGSSYYFSDQKCPRNLRKVPYGSMVWSLMKSTRNLQCVSDHLMLNPKVDMVTINLLMSDLGAYNEDQHFGRIQVLQEQGCKARVVFQPSARLQLSFYPLHRILATINRTCFRESCTEDQVKGVYKAVQHLEDGHDVYSVDLSSATDRFPRSFTIKVLRHLGLNSHAQSLQQLCTESFPCAQSGKELKYGAGQPMGLYGSFPMFQLSNALVADVAVAVSMEAGLKPIPFRDGTFFSVLGDDIIFSDKHVAAYYSDTMRNLGCDISPSKTFSGKVGEFAGFVVLPVDKTRNQYTAFRPYKVPDGSKISNGLEFLHALGSKAKKVSPYWSRMFEAYSRTLGQRDLSLSPLVHEDHPTATQRASSQWMNALGNTVLMYADDIEKLNLQDIPEVRGVFYDPPPPHNPWDAGTYMTNDFHRKSRKRNQRHTLTDDPLIREFIKTSGFAETASLKRKPLNRKRSGHDDGLDLSR